MKKYYCRAGRHDFKPNRWTQIVPLQYRGFSFCFSLNESCWFEDDTPNRYQQNKVCGITAAFSANNSRAALVSWQVTGQPGLFIATGYVNYPDRSFAFYQPGIAFSAGEEVRGSAVIQEREPTVAEVLLNPYAKQYEVAYTMQSESMSVPARFSLSFEPAWHGLYREVGPWFGGRDTAPQSMSLFSNLIRQ